MKSSPPITRNSMKKYNEEERPHGECYDCRIPYTTFPDMVISDELWEVINPTYHIGAGLLCPTCIARRLKLANVGIVDCVLHT